MSPQKCNALVNLCVSNPDISSKNKEIYLKGIWEHQWAIQYNTDFPLNTVQILVLDLSTYQCTSEPLGHQQTSGKETSIRKWEKYMMGIWQHQSASPNHPFPFQIGLCPHLGPLHCAIHNLQTKIIKYTATNLNPWHDMYLFYMVFLYHLVLVLECELVQLKCQILAISFRRFVDYDESHNMF